jgi:hypothetical protein
MSHLSNFTLEQHRVYLLRDFQQRENGDIVCSAFALIKPDHILAACFPNATIISSWQAHQDSAKLPWPLEVVSFHTARLAGKRFRFTLDCIDFRQEWESEWPQLTDPLHAPLKT